MKLPTLQGIIRRRMLVNFRVDPAAIEPLLPAPFRLQLHRRHAIAGICLIRLEQVRLAGLPEFAGFSSENAAHRIAVEWTNRSGYTQTGVYILRRDTASALGHLAGGCLFPGVHHLAEFQVTEKDRGIDFAMRSRDGRVAVRLQGEETTTWPASSCFSSLDDSSHFFACGCVGFSPAREAGRLEGLRLETQRWDVRALAVSRVESNWLAELSQQFPGAVQFDHALIMRDIPHRWHAVGGPL